MSEHINQIVFRHASAIEDQYVFFRPNIPPKKIRNAIRAYAKDVELEEVLALIDSTSFGSAKDGALLTATAFYAHNSLQKPTSIRLTDVDSIAFKEARLGNEIAINHTLFLTTLYPSKEALAAFARMLEEVVIASSGKEADERRRTEWEDKRQGLIKTLETIKSADLPTVLRDLDLVVAKLDLGSSSRAMDLDERRRALTLNLSTAAQKDRPELVRALTIIYEELSKQSEFLEGPEPALRLRLDYLNMAEAHVNDMISLQKDDAPEIVGLLGGEGASIGWAHGAAVIARGTLLEKIREERVRLMEAGLICSIGYCHRCKEIYSLDTSLACPVSPKHNLKEVIFMMPDDCAEGEQALRERFKLGPRAER
jgi:hypothetical protein